MSIANETRPVLNVPLMEATMARIIAEPEKLNMALWSCGTTRCFAGHAVELAGAQMVSDDGSAECVECVTADGSWRTIGAYAQEVLGLTDAQAIDLFESEQAFHNTTVDELHRKVKHIIESAQAGE